MGFGGAAEAALNIILGSKDDTKAGMSSAGKNIDEVGKKAQHLGEIASLTMTAPLIVFGKTAVDAASNTAESMSKVEVVFGKGSASIKTFASTAATNLGMSNQAALEAAGTFGNLFVALGLGPEKTVEMSKSILTLGADLASFNNLDPAVVLEKLRAGLLGEAEPLRTVGVNINEARIQAEAFAIGLVKPVQDAPKITAAHLAVEAAVTNLAKAQKGHGKESIEARKAASDLELANQHLTDSVAGNIPALNAAQKAQAAYSVIMKDTKTAQGDFSRTSDGLANSTRIAKAEFEDAQAQLGAELLPTVVQVTHAGILFMKMFSGLSQETKNHIVIAGVLLAALGPVVGVIGTLITVFNGAAVAISAVSGSAALASIRMAIVRVATIAWTAMQWLLNVALTANPIGLVIVAIALLAAGFYLAYQKVKPFHDLVDTLWQKLKDFWGWLQDHVFHIPGMSTSNGGPAVNPSSRVVSRGGRAAGGSMEPNSWYRVGEQGPEDVLMGDRGGFVIPNRGGGGGSSSSVSHHYNLTLYGAGAANDPEGVRRILQRIEFLGATG